MAESSSRSSSLELLNQVAQVLESEKIRWSAIGAIAVAYHGVIRASVDADALVSLHNARIEIEKLGRKLQTHGWQVETRIGDDEDSLGFVIRIQGTEGNQVDLIGGIRKLDPLFFDRGISADFEGWKLRIASAEDVVALKVFAGSAKDLEDASGIVEVLGATLNRDLVLKLCRRFGRNEEAVCKKLLDAATSSTDSPKPPQNPSSK